MTTKLINTDIFLPDKLQWRTASLNGVTSTVLRGTMLMALLMSNAIAVQAQAVPTPAIPAPAVNPPPAVPGPGAKPAPAIPDNAGGPAAPGNAGPPVATIPTTSPHAYTLDECLQAALQAPILTKEQSITLDRAHNRESLAKSNLGPTYSSVGIVKVRSDRNLSDSSGDQVAFAGERFRAGVTVNYPLYDGGMRRTRVKIAHLGTQRTEFSQIGENNRVSIATVSAFYNVLQGQRLLEGVYRRMTETQEHLNDVNSRLQIGTVTRGDQLQAQSALASTNAELSRRKYALVAAQSRLALLMGLDPVKDRFLVAAPAPVTFNTNADSLGDTAVAASPQFNQLHIGQQIRQEQLNLIRERNRPTVTAVGGVGISDHSNIGGGDESTKPYVFVGLNLTVPLFENAAQRARVREQKDTIALNELRFTDYRKRVLLNAELTKEAYEASLDTIAASTQAVSSAEEAYRLAAERYAVGKAAQFEVLRALDRLESARDRLAGAEGSRDRLAINLRYLTRASPNTSGVDPLIAPDETPGPDGNFEPADPLSVPDVTAPGDAPMQPDGAIVPDAVQAPTDTPDMTDTPDVASNPASTTNR